MDLCMNLYQLIQKEVAQSVGGGLQNTPTAFSEEW